MSHVREMPQALGPAASARPPEPHSAQRQSPAPDALAGLHRRIQTMQLSRHARQQICSRHPPMRDALDVHASRESRIHGSGCPRRSQAAGSRRREPSSLAISSAVSRLAHFFVPCAAVSCLDLSSCDLEPRVASSLRRKHDSMLARLLRPWVPFGFSLAPLGPL